MAVTKEVKQARDKIVQWIRDYFAENGPECSAVIGISGGKDSSIAAALCVEALGRDRVVGVYMPNGAQNDLSDVKLLSEHLGVKFDEVNIEEVVDEFVTRFYFGILRCKMSDHAVINIPPRIRMAYLYAVAQSLPNGGRVVNTCNLSEDYVGYSTKYGDAAGDFAPLHNLLVRDVKMIGHALGLPESLVEKAPADGLCGKTDEDNLGFTYDQLDDYIETGTSDDASVDERISELHQKNLHKALNIPYPKIRRFDLEGDIG